MATPTVADLRAHVASLHEAVARRRDDPRFPPEMLDALAARAEEVDKSALELARKRRTA